MFDFKIIGSMKYVPFGMLVIVCAFCYLFQRDIHVYGIVLEMMVPCLGIWWSGYFLSEHTEDAAIRGVIYSVNKRMKRYLIRKYFLYTLFWLILGTALTGVILYRNEGRIMWEPLRVIFLKGIFLAAVVFVTVALIRDASWAIIIVVSLLCVDYCLDGAVLGKLRISLNWYRIESVVATVDYYVIPLLVSMALIGIGSVKILKRGE